MLISSADLLEVKTEPDDEIKPYTTKASSRFGISPIGGSVKDAVGNLEKNETLFIPTRGTWSNHDLLELILKKTGPAKVWITSWTVSEIAVRTLIQLIDTKQIEEIHCLFDERIKVHCPQAHQLAKNAVVDMKLAKIHAKCIAVLNDDWGVAVVTSANFTRNPRIEAYSICSDRSIAESFKDWIQNEMDNKRPFEKDEDESI